MKIGFCSDIHMDMASQEAKKIFYEEVKAAGTELLIIAGDIGTAMNEAEAYVRDIEENTGTKVLWVRGNHDFWNSSITRLRSLTKHEGYMTNWDCARTVEDLMAPEMEPMDAQEAAELAKLVAVRRQERTYTIAEIKKILHESPCGSDHTRPKDTLIVGHDGWYDARAGTPMLSIDMNDWRYTTEFKGKTKHQIIHIAREFADQAERHFTKLLTNVLCDGCIERVIIVTHVPPFQEAHIDPKGNPGNNQWAPWFVNAKLGDWLLSLADHNPDIQFSVYCGHTHGACEYAPRANLTITVAGANYKHPKFWGLI